MTDNLFALPGPDNLNLIRLKNGLQVLVRENPSTPIVALDGYLRTGAVHDPNNLAGLASFVADMLTHGSAAYSYDRFNDLVESVGANLVISGDTHATSLSVSGLNEDFGMLLALLADAVQRPTFSGDQIELVRAQTLVYHQEREQDTSRMAGIRFYAAVYGDHPYGKPVSGTPSTVHTFKRQDLVDFHAQHYTPQGATLVLSGNVKASQAIELIGEHFGAWTGPEPDRSLAAPLFAGQPERITLVMEDKYQSDIVMGFPAIPRRHPDYDALRVANTILGRFGMMGRLGEAVREDLGLAYYCYSTHDAEELGGVWLASAGVNPANVEAAIDAIRAEFDRLVTELVSPEELADSQAYLTGILPLTLETNEGISATLLNMLWHDLGLDFLHRYNDLIYTVTREDVQRVAAAYLRPERCIISIAGPGGV